MYVLNDIRFTKEKLNTLYKLGVMYALFGPEASFIMRWFSRIFRSTYLGEKKDKWAADSLRKFYREFRSLQQYSYIPPRYWDNKVLNLFENYVLNERACTVKECIKLYESQRENSETSSKQT